MNTIKAENGRKGEISMKRYEKPMVLQTEQMSEGVYLASGAGGCYTADAYIHQTPQTGRGDYRIQVNGKHNADHTKEAQVLTITFNQPVTYVSGGSGLLSGNGTTTLKVKLGYHQNPTDNIGFGDLTVTSEQGLSITGVSITD